MTPLTETRLTLPQTFRAAPVFQAGMAAFTALGVLAANFITPHVGKFSLLIWLLTGLYLLGMALVLSLRVKVDADGLAQAWFWSVQRTPWKQVTRLERTTRGYALLNASGKEVMLLSLLPRAAQQAVAGEAIARARLKPGKTQPKPPVLEYWERK